MGKVAAVDDVGLALLFQSHHCPSVKPQVGRRVGGEEGLAPSCSHHGVGDGENSGTGVQKGLA